MDVFSMELEIRLTFVKILKSRGGGGVFNHPTPHGT
jgi:hypothetical protein